MNYLPDLETRWHEPIEIPRREIVVPMPRRWFDFINLRKVDLSSAIAGLVTEDGAETLARAKPLPVFERLWRGGLAEVEVPAMDRGMVNAALVLREDVVECARCAARAAGCTVHELLLKIIGRLMPSIDHHARPRRRRPRGGGKITLSAAGNIVPGPW